MMKMYQGSILCSESEPQPGSMDTIPPAGSVLFKPEHATQHCFNQMLESQFTSLQSAFYTYEHPRSMKVIFIILLVAGACFDHEY